MAFAVLCLVMAGCALIKVKQDNQKGLESTVIVGRVYGEFTEDGPIIVAACSANKKMKIAHYTVLHDSGEYELVVGHGNYFVFAFCDKNSNLVYEAGEPAGQHGHPKLVRVPAVGVVFDIDIKIPNGGRNIVVHHGTEISLPKPQKLYSRQAGAVLDLNDEHFSEEYGRKGYWESGSFFKELGGNIYFLEEYDPEKIPILFIHGATGTPKGWRYFVDHIDRTRFQPWFYYYPSGARINSMAYLLLWKLTNLQSKYQFNRIYITAHSMGGLVARSFIVNYHQQFPYVRLFISLATPWGGDEMAGRGVKQLPKVISLYRNVKRSISKITPWDDDQMPEQDERQAPAVIPSWIDMQPEGDFIKSLYQKKLPEYVSFYIFSGLKGSRNPLRSNNDGTVTLASTLDYRPQSEAKMNYVFKEDHTSILFSKEVVEQYKTILDEFDEKQSASLHRSEGYVKIHFEYTYEFDGVRPRPIFILSPVGKKDAGTVSYLSNNDNGKILGPFPSGDYLAAMAAMAAMPQKKYISVSLENNKTKELKFIFSPDGEIYGCVTTSLKPEDSFAGRPDYTYRAADEDIHVQFVQLKGNGIQRTLQPIEGDATENDFLISRKDYCYNNCFGFFGLPAGDYKLFIKAKNYKPVEKSYSVKPGTPKYFRATELTPD
jgi:pimeloyl-ACP methyl ester carboxylesterase